MNTALPSGWVRARLDEVADVIMGQSPLGASTNVAGDGTPFFQGKAEFGVLRPTIRKWTTQPTKIANEGDILVSVRAPVGPTNLAPADCCIGRGLASIRPLGKMDRDYLLWAMRATEQHLSGRGVGTTFSAVGGDVVRAHEVLVAPVEEQRRIVAILDEALSMLDAAGASLASARRLEPRLHDGLCKERLLCAATGVPRRALGDFAHVAGGVTKDAKRQGDPSFVAVPYLRVANVQRGWLDLRDVGTIRVDSRKATTLELQAGDVLLNEGGDRDKLGRGWVWENQVPRCIHQNHVFRARVDPSVAEPKFVSWWANTVGREWFEANGRQTTNLASIALTTLKRFPVPLPDLDEQRAAVADLDAIITVGAALKREIVRATDGADSLRRALLATAFSGRLVPQDRTDEPASVLLERIRAQRASAAPRRRGRASRRVAAPG